MSVYSVQKGKRANVLLVIPSGRGATSFRATVSRLKLRATEFRVFPCKSESGEDYIAARRAAKAQADAWEAAEDIDGEVA